MFIQCTLRRTADTGFEFLTTWIPEKLALLNQNINIKENNIWYGPWLVTSCGEKRLEPPQYRETIKSFKSLKPNKRKKNV